MYWIGLFDTYRPFSHCIDQAGLGAFTAKSGRKHYNPPPLTVMWMNFDSPNYPSFCSLSAIISFQTCSNKCILYVLSFHKCIKIKYKMVNMYGVFRDWCKVHPAEILYTLIATAVSNLVFSWVFGSVNSVTRPNRRNAKMVYKTWFFPQMWLNFNCSPWSYHFEIKTAHLHFCTQKSTRAPGRAKLAE